MRKARRRDQADVGDERVPADGVFVQVDAADLVEQRLAAADGRHRVLRRLLDAEHPALLVGQLLGDVLDRLLHALVIAVVAEKSWHALGQRCPARPGEGEGCVVAGGAHDREFGEFLAQAALLHSVVDALRQRHGGQPRAMEVDQVLVFGQRRHRRAFGQQRSQVAVQRFAFLGGERASELSVPVVLEIRLQRIGIEVLHVVQHQIGLQRLVLCFRGTARLAELILDAQADARQHRVDQHPLIAATGRAVELRALVQTEAELSRDVLSRAGQAARCGQCRQDRQEIGGGPIRRCLDQLPDLADTLRNLVDVAPVVDVAEDPRADGRGQDNADGRIACEDKPGPASLPFQVGVGEPAFVEHHFAEQPRQKVASAARLVRLDDGALEAIAASDRAEHAIDRRSLLGPAHEINAAQHGIGFVGRGGERDLEKFLDNAAQSGELAGEAIDARPLLRIPFGLKPIDQAVFQAAHEQIELVAESLQVLRRAVLQRKGRTPGRRALVLVDRCEVVGEACEQVRLRDQKIDRKPYAEALVQLEQPLAHRHGVLAPLRQRARQEVGDGDGDEYAVHRLPRSRSLQHGQKAAPRGAVIFPVAVLGGKASGSVDQDCPVGEPPVAVAGAADAADGLVPGGIGERKLQSRMTQCSGLAGPWRADDQVPRQLIEIAAVELGLPARKEATAGTETCPPQRQQRFLEALSHGQHVGGFGGRLFAGRSREQLPDHGRVAAT